MYKWILGIIGFYIFRLPGFFIGLFIGHQIDKNSFIKIRNNIKKEFELNLLALASILIKSDGNVSQKELQYVRNYFISIYGQARAEVLFKQFNNNIDKRNISAEKICSFFLRRTTYGTRLQLIHFLFNIAKELDENNEMMLVGSGEKGRDPLIFQNNGLPWRAFLEGRVQDDSYALLMRLSNLELKSIS